jgi:type VI secretion system secreted protein Hcp
MAQVDYFMELEGIKGESKDSKMAGKMQLESWSWGETNSGTHGSAGGGAGAGKVSIQDFHFAKKVDVASPNLMLACAEGRHIKTGVLTSRKAGKDQQEFLVFKFTDVLISSYSVGGSGSSDVVPVDQVAINFGKIEWAYKPQKADGTLDAAVKGGWDIVKNAKV